MQIIKGKQYFDVREFSDIREMYAQSLELFGDTDAFVFRDTPQSEIRHRTYREFYDDSLRLGTAMASLGLLGKRVAVIGENSYAWCLTHFTVICGVGVSVPLDRLLPEEEIISLVKRGETDAIVYDPSFHETMEKIAETDTGVRHFICMNDFLFRERPGSFKKGFMYIRDLIDKGQKLLDGGDRTYSEAKIDPQALMSLLFTSGTTSASKAVMLSHRNVCSDIKALAGVVYFEKGTKVLSVLPLHHTFENTCGFLGGFYFGFTIYESDGLRYIQKNMEEHKINCLIGVPLLFESFYTKIWDTVKKQGKEKTLRKGIKISNFLRKIGIDKRKDLFKDITAKFGGEFITGICGAAPIDPGIIEFFDAIGVRILQGYGLTETSPVVAGCNDRVFVPGTVGHPLAGVEIAIDNAQDGLEGEILVRGDMVMMGYYGNELASAETIDGQGWLHTGDIGLIGRKDGCIRITGRQKSMIVLKNGKKVFPEEIEFLLGQYNFIKESLVWGEAEEDGDVDVWARIVLDRDVISSEGGDISDESGISIKISELLKEINRKLPSFKAVKYFIFGEDDMAKTTTRKIKRNVELDSIRQTLAKNSMKIKEAAGRNIDAIKNMLNHDKKDED